MLIILEYDNGIIWHYYNPTVPWGHQADKRRCNAIVLELFSYIIPVSILNSKLLLYQQNLSSDLSHPI